MEHMRDAIRVGNVAALSIALDMGLNVNEVSRNGETPIMYAMRRWRIIPTAVLPMVKLLLSHGADVHQRCLLGKTALHYAAISGAPADAIQLLLNAMGDRNVMNVGQYCQLTPLHYFAWRGDLRNVALWLSYPGVDTSAGERLTGETAENMARRWEHLDVAHAIQIYSVRESRWRPIYDLDQISPRHRFEIAKIC
jgi:ankyrin repeat protein